jgi:hypothetical protein
MSFGFLVINVRNHRELYETSCIFVFITSLGAIFDCGYNKKISLGSKQQ